MYAIQWKNTGTGGWETCSEHADFGWGRGYVETMCVFTHTEDAEACLEDWCESCPGDEYRLIEVDIVVK